MTTPTEIRQYEYCPRVVFFERCTPVYRRETLRMTYGRETHEVENALEKYRSLQRYGLHEGVREFNVSLVDETLGLSGVADVVVTVGTQTFPIEFKDSEGEPTMGHQMQLCAYGLLLESVRRVDSPRGYWHSARSRETRVVEFDSKLRKRTLQAIRAINEFIRAERCPEPTQKLAKCLDCELKNYCGDIF